MKGGAGEKGEEKRKRKGRTEEDEGRKKKEEGQMERGERELGWRVKMMEEGGKGTGGTANEMRGKEGGESK